MKQAFLSVDLGFGDSGKGSTTDWLCREFACDLVVRYSGGFQAGHNVELENGTRHKFSQFGSGTFAGAKTYLGPSMIINPRGILAEATDLIINGVAQPLNLLRIHPDCLVTTLFHQAMNRIREGSRSMRHGSCGLGIGETRSYWLSYGQDAIFARDLLDPDVLRGKLDLMQQRYWHEIVSSPSNEFSILDENYFHDWNCNQIAIQLCSDASLLIFDTHLQNHKSVVYEASQGMLIDQTYGFHPYNTWSDVSLRPALQMIKMNEYENIITLGITRAYSCRHGQGPLPSYSRSFTESHQDPGNPFNEWQGDMRMGPLDLTLLDYAVRNCGASLDGLVVNHLDQIGDETEVCTGYCGQNNDWILSRLTTRHTLQNQAEIGDALMFAQPELDTVKKADLLQVISDHVQVPIFATANGPTHRHRQCAIHG